MIAEKFFRIAQGLIKANIPSRRLHKPSATGGSTYSRYCYSTWLRHLILLHKYKKNIPAAVAELGPGDSVGTGIAALLSGCEKYIALDILLNIINYKKGTGLHQNQIAKEFRHLAKDYVETQVAYMLAAKRK